MIYGHTGIIAAKSAHFAKIVREKLPQKVRKEDHLVIDFGGQVNYEAFRKIVDYLYLDDLKVLDDITDSTELLDIIKLSKQYQLDQLFKAAEVHFQEVMQSWFETSSFLQIKQPTLVQTTSKRAPIKKEEQRPSDQDPQTKEILRARVTTQVSQQSQNPNTTLSAKKRKYTLA